MVYTVISSRKEYDPSNTGPRVKCSLYLFSIKPLNVKYG